MQPVVLSLGMGVDSTGILVRWLTDPSTRDFPLSALWVLIGQVGDEYPDTYDNVERVLLPMLAAHRVRVVQVARPSLTIGRGERRYVVLDDRPGPDRLVRAGPVRLSDELFGNGTIAQVANRRCSLKWKGDPLDAWIADNVQPGHVHVLGYGADEQRRITRDRKITRHGRMPDYPLQRWGWTRSTTGLFLRNITGQVWKRSCCYHCPFQAARISRSGWAQRWREFPGLAARGLELEYRALALNPRMPMFGKLSAWSLARAHQLDEAIGIAHQQLASARWALYEVRRSYNGPAPVMRSVRTLARGSRRQMTAALAARGRVTVDDHGIARVWLLPQSQQPVRAEHLLVAAPVGIVDKQRPTFESVWSAHATDPAPDSGCLPCAG
jgi:hypothetical protein